MYQLPPQEYERVRGFFAPLRYNLVVDSMLDGNTPAWVFVDDAERPRLSLAWDRQDAMLLAGDGPAAGFGPALAALLADRIIPDARSRGIPALSMHFAPESYVEPLAAALAPWQAALAPRRFYRFDGPRVGWRAAVPAGCSVRRIDRELLAGNLENTGQVRGWVGSFWRSDDDFLRTGFGYCLLQGETVASWCLTVFASGQGREVGVATARPYRQQGYATLAAAACLEHCATAGFTPHWHCWDDNYPSAALAERAGFVDPVIYTVYRFAT